MNTCKTCKWWHKYTKVSEYDPYPEVTLSVGECKNENFGSSEINNDCTWLPKPNGANACYDNNPAVTINTGPEFGCIHHEVRDENTN